MATYKVIQDIEAEDHILGPLSLRQFIYGLIAAFLLYLCFICITKGLAFVVIILLPPALFCAFFAFPFGKDQPTEVWALAKIRFLFKPRKRIWNQSGVKELVTITVPKKIEVQLTDGLSQMEVKSRLRALADTIDSRGWAVKNAVSGMYVQPSATRGDSDRLISIGSIPQPVSEADGGIDMLDETSSPLAQQFSTMMDASARTRRQQLIEQLNARAQAVAPQPQQWFTQPATAVAQPITATPDDVTMPLPAKLPPEANANAHLRNIPASPQPTTTDSSTPVAAPTPPPAQPVTPPPDPAILNLATNNDLNVATLAREAKKAKGLEDGEEVVVSLH